MNNAGKRRISHLRDGDYSHRPPGGFIRAEVVPYDEFAVCRSLPECRTAGALRLEGKDYPVRDGDIINFRFAV